MAKIIVDWLFAERNLSKIKHIILLVKSHLYTFLIFTLFFSFLVNAKHQEEINQIKSEHQNQVIILFRKRDFIFMHGIKIIIKHTKH